MNYPGNFISLSLINVSALARDLGISRQTLYNVWNGVNRPSIDLAFQIVEVLQMPSSFVVIYSRNEICMEKLWDVFDNKDINMYSVWMY